MTGSLFGEVGRGRLAVPVCPCGRRADTPAGIVDRVIVDGRVSTVRTYACQGCGETFTDALADPDDTPTLF